MLIIHTGILALDSRPFGRSSRAVYAPHSHGYISANYEGEGETIRSELADAAVVLAYESI